MNTTPMEKFENVDVLDTLRRIMKQNTAFYRSDFTYDCNMIWQNAVLGQPEDKKLLWFSRPSGTVCFKEKDVFLRDTYPHNTWKFYGEQTNDHILAYMVELTGAEDDTVYGNIYPLDYDAHWKQVAEKSVAPDMVRITFQNGDVRTFAFEDYKEHRGSIIDYYGDFKEVVPSLHEPERLGEILEQCQEQRASATPVKLGPHLQKLQKDMVWREAARILAELQKPEAPNSPNGTHFMAEVSPYFLQIASNKDRDQLLELLPFSKLSLSTLKDRRGIFAMIPRNEDRNKPLRKPSVRKKLWERADTSGEPKSPRKDRRKDQER